MSSHRSYDQPRRNGSRDDAHHDDLMSPEQRPPAAPIRVPLATDVRGSARYVPPSEFGHDPVVTSSPDRALHRSNTGNTSNLAPSQRIRHYARLLVAEKPMDSHRAFQRRMRTGELEDPADAASPGVLPLTTTAAAAAGNQDAALETINAGIPLPQTPTSAVPSRPPSRNGTSSSGRKATGSAAAAAAAMVAASSLPSALTGPVGDSSDPEYEALRKKYKHGFKYRLIRREILKNKRRRGRAKYLATLKTLYNSIVPSGGRTEPQKVSQAQALKGYLYMAAMIVFDFITPTLLGMNASLVLVFVSACMAMTTFFAAGQRRAWLEGISAAEGGVLAAEDEQPWGPQRLWDRYIAENERIGEGVYLTEWGAVGAAVIKASGEPWRYLAAVLVHESVWHLFLIGGCAIVAGVLVERRYGIMRMTIMLAMLALSSSMAAVLLDGECDIAYGASPLAWGLITWWGVDTAARVTLWPLRDAGRLRKVVGTYKNLSNLLLLLCTLITLIISELALGVSSAAAAIAAVLSVLAIAPVIAPRWATSAMEAATVPLAVAGAILFWVVLPIAGAGRAAGITDTELASCVNVQLIPA
eukprot:jgi/Ulvmu1/7186/UM034_0095.1